MNVSSILFAMVTFGVLETKFTIQIEMIYKRRFETVEMKMEKKLHSILVFTLYPEYSTLIIFIRTEKAIVFQHTLSLSRICRIYI